ncbi:MAG: MEMO1 family protein [Methanocellales archaeon]|nr:MEMO1 family protein [Methanocellales archaeon]
MRRPVVAGQFYRGDPEGLISQLKGCFDVSVPEEGNAKGGVAPHAGYVYSGQVAAHVYAAIPSAETYVLIGPNHHAIGPTVALSKETWSTPLGKVEVDKEIVDDLSSSIDVDEVAHKYEHSIEVQLPFLQYRFKDFKIVSISMGLQDEETVKEVSVDLANALRGKEVVVLASSDFTHYEPEKVAREKDNSVIEAILELDISKFYSRIYEHHMSVCGYGPIAVMMETTKALGAKKGKLLKYATSGDVTGDKSSVVGYAGIVVV